MKRSTCKGCGAAIVWAVNPATGKRVPLEPAGRVLYRAIELPDGSVEAIREDPTPTDDPIMRSHFETCPKANDFSKASG